MALHSYFQAFRPGTLLQKRIRTNRMMKNCKNFGSPPTHVQLVPDQSFLQSIRLTVGQAKKRLHPDYAATSCARCRRPGDTKRSAIGYTLRVRFLALGRNI